MLLDAIPIKTVDVEVVEETQVIPCGTPFGVKIFTQGVVVVGMSDLKASGKTVNPARSAGLKIGDVITSINGIQVNTNEEVAAIIEKSGGVPLSLAVLRSNMSFEVEITPVKADDGTSYKAGLWVRDSSAGIGTLTFYNPEGHSFAGLGHGSATLTQAT
ncbi:PDZ domain-containing protein [[Clostridium] leptum]|uniref:PDZ domain-containing protein n=1 Tax=[Clostridium] leptum TaxID=1535 RepID=A0A412AUY2_9FIRM|nr:PDZ domain-containing protein [[Clostridium] leptum]